MASASFTLRPYAPADEDAAIELWRRTWQLAYPRINFNERVDWWRQRWRQELVPVATITVAEAGKDMVGFVTVDPRTRELVFQAIIKETGIVVRQVPDESLLRLRSYLRDMREAEDRERDVRRVERIA